MAKLPIITAPDPRLKVKAKPVGTVDDATRRLMDDMLESMYAAPGIGLAAPQVGVAKRVIVLDISSQDDARQPLRIADPEIVWVSDDDVTYEEGCLSVPEHYADVVRPRAVKVRCRDYDDNLIEIDAEGLLATCLQHEMDHLDGVLFIDRISALKRNIILRKLVKARKLAEADVDADA
ncbi:MAG: peptide deformylase [Alphaproteobacteria bacterium]|nr:peptide deformylase [Alphaproteobacteria bacterium]